MMFVWHADETVSGLIFNDTNRNTIYERNTNASIVLPQLFHSNFPKRREEALKLAIFSPLDTKRIHLVCECKMNTEALVCAPLTYLNHISLHGALCNEYNYVFIKLTSSNVLAYVHFTRFTSWG